MQNAFYLVVLLSMLLLSFGESIHAQAVVASQEITVSNETRYELFAASGDQVVLYRDEPGEVTLTAFNAQMDLVWERELDLDKSRPNPIGAAVSQGEVAVFYTFRKDRGLHLKVHRYSERGNLSDSMTITELTDNFLTSNWQLLLDPTSTYGILVHQRDGDTYLVMGIELSSGRLLYQRQVKLDASTSLTREANRAYVDEQGAVYLWLEENNRRSRLEEHQLKLWRVSIDGNTESALITLPEVLVFDLELAVDELNQRVTLAGYYAEDPDEAAGSLLIQLPYSLEGTATVVQSAFAEEVLLAVDQKARAPEGISDLDAIDVEFRRDGTVLLIGEQRKQTVRTVGSRSGYFGGSLKTDYLYEDIVISTISPDGSRVWQEVLPKKQFSQDDGAAFSSYYLASSPRALRLIYNDEVRSGGTVSEYTLAGNGAIERHSLMNTEYQNLWLRLEAGVQKDARTVVIPSERRNRLKLVRVEF